MAVRVLFVFWHGSQPEACQSYDGRRRVGQIVDAVGHYGDAARDQPYHDFHDAEEAVGNYAHYTCQFSVRVSHFNIFYVFMVFYELFEQKIAHTHIGSSL